MLDQEAVARSKLVGLTQEEAAAQQRYNSALAAQQDIKADGGIDRGIDLFDAQHVAFLDTILLATRSDHCIHMVTPPIFNTRRAPAAPKGI